MNTNQHITMEYLRDTAPAQNIYYDAAVTRCNLSALITDNAYGLLTQLRSAMHKGGTNHMQFDLDEMTSETPRDRIECRYTVFPDISMANIRFENRGAILYVEMLNSLVALLTFCLDHIYETNPAALEDQRFMNVHDFIHIVPGSAVSMLFDLFIYETYAIIKF